MDKNYPNTELVYIEYPQWCSHQEILERALEVSLEHVHDHSDRQYLKSLVNVEKRNEDFCDLP